MHLDLLPNETVIKAADGKHHNGKATTSGKLILTTKRILFADSQSASVLFSIEPSSIHEVLPFSAGLFSGKGLQVVLKDGNQVNFTMGDVGHWAKLINKMY